MSSLPLRRRLPATLLASALLLGSAAALAQFPRPAPVGAPTPPAEPVADPYGRETARGCLFGFLRAAERNNMENAAAYLQIPPSLKGSRVAIARQLQIVFDHRFITANMDRISRHPRGGLEDGLPPDQEKVGEVRGSDGRVDVILVRQEAREGVPGVWLISWETVRACRQLYDELDFPDIDRALPPVFSKTRVGAMSLWQVLGFLLLLPVLFVVSGVFVGAILFAARLLRRTSGTPDEPGRWTAPARRPATFILTLFLHRIAVMWLGMPVLYRLYYDRVIVLLVLVGLFWLLARLIDVLNSRLLARVLPAGAAARGPTLSLASRALKLGAFVVVALLAMAAFGVNLTATLAGLGIGGIALAFAAQKTLENFLGGIAILADKGLAIGETCRIGAHQGEIEDITLWATRIRTRGRTVVSIPNGQVSASQIENLTRRDKFWFHPTVGLVYQTTAQQMREVLEGIRRMLAADPRVETETIRVRFRTLGASSLDVEVFAYVRAAAFPDFLAVQEELLLQILEIVSAAGTSVAFPSRTVYLEGGGAGKESPR